eukprot:95203_1
MQEINIFDPNLAQTHPTLVPWVQGMQQAGYTPPQIQMYFKQQTQAQLQLHEQNNAQRQQQKLQMAQNIVHAYQGRVTLEQVMSMAFDRVQNLYKEIVSRINQTSGQPQHDQSSHNNNTNSNPQPPPVQQNMNIFDPSLIHAHPTLVPWVQSMQQAGYTPEQTQMYFQQQIQAQSYPQQQKQKVQMAQNIAQAYQGRVTLEQVLAMSFERVQNLYQEIISRLNQLDTQQDVTTNNRKRVLASPDDNADIGPATKRQKMDENKPSQQLLDKKIEDFQKRMRAAKFTKKDGEIINNSCYIKQKIQIKDSTSDLWVNATVIDKENNWIVVHFDRCSAIYDQQIHVVQNKDKIRITWGKEDGKKDQSDDEVPDHLCDPISFEPMKEPMLVVVSGITYEKSVIEEYIKENGQDPMTRKSVTLDQLVPNRALRDTIDAWRRKHPGIISDDENNTDKEDDHLTQNTKEFTNNNKK